MSAERLRAILHNVADETRAVPLEEAAMAESRRMGVRRTVIGAAAVAALLVAGVVGGAAVWSDRGAAPVDPAVSDSPTPSEESLPETTGNLTETILYYIDGDNLNTITDNTSAMQPLQNEPYLAATANVSPDGRYVSWISADFKLKVYDTATEKQRDLTAYASDFCQEPVWSINSNELLIKQGDDFGFLNLDSGFTPLGFDLDGCHVQLDEAPGGNTAIERQFLYVDLGKDAILRYDDKGGLISETSNRIGEDREIIGLQSRADGEYTCFVTQPVGNTLGDFVRSPSCDTLGEFNGEDWDVVPTGPGEVMSANPKMGEEVVVRQADPEGQRPRFAGYTDGVLVWIEPEFMGLRDWQLLAWR